MKVNSKALRIATAALVIVLIAVGFATNWGIGTLSAPGLWDISLLCPLGALGTMLASKAMIPRAVVSLVIMVALIVLFARTFCGWLCPIPLVQRIRHLFLKRQPSKHEGAPTSQNFAMSADIETSSPPKQPLSAIPSGERNFQEKTALTPSCAKSSTSCSNCKVKRGDRIDARHLVLGGALASTLVFGFPVFCLICPIGLTFATILLLINLFAHGDVTWSLVVVPGLLAAEVILFRKWCHRLCPLSAFMSLIAKANKTFVPTIDDKTCLETSHGVSCGICGKVCEEGIDPRHPQLSQASWGECTKCRACVEACPAHAITMPFLLPKKKVNANVPLVSDDTAKENS